MQNELHQDISNDNIAVRTLPDHHPVSRQHIHRFAFFDIECAVESINVAKAGRSWSDAGFLRDGYSVPKDWRSPDRNAVHW